MSLPDRTSTLGTHTLVVPDDPRFVWGLGEWNWEDSRRLLHTLRSLHNNVGCDRSREWQSCCDRARCAWLDEAARFQHTHSTPQAHAQCVACAAERESWAWRRAGEDKR